MISDIFNDYILGYMQGLPSFVISTIKYNLDSKQLLLMMEQCHLRSLCVAKSILVLPGHSSIFVNIRPESRSVVTIWCLNLSGFLDPTINRVLVKVAPDHPSCRPWTRASGLLPLNRAPLPLKDACS